jgi:hypothetical protein
VPKVNLPRVLSVASHFILRNVSTQYLVSAGYVVCLPVLWGDLAEVCLDDGTVLSAVETAGVGASTKVLLAFSLHRSIDALRRLTLVEEWLWVCKRGSRDQRTGGQEGDERELHVGLIVRR